MRNFKMRKRGITRLHALAYPAGPCGPSRHYRLGSNHGCRVGPSVPIAAFDQAVLRPVVTRRVSEGLFRTGVRFPHRRHFAAAAQPIVHENDSILL